MASSTSHPPVTAARIKTAAVQDDVQQAEADLHDANEELAETVVGTIVTKESVEAALVQNLHVEGQLHDAVKELQAVTELLEIAEGKVAAAGEDTTLAGRRSGEGVNSVLEHMSASSRRRNLKA
ncbi:MAG: hypothetical protein JWP22_3405 [Ramlibacter sp.]|jgi:hypothetical protein|nr:hypothetical protein [Ramlibacter sp.]MDB5914730.1 hypothetical protein [Ramlibacter sp.]